MFLLYLGLSLVTLAGAVWFESVHWGWLIGYATGVAVQINYGSRKESEK